MSLPERWTKVALTVVGAIISLIGFDGVFVALEIPPVNIAAIQATVDETVHSSCTSPTPVPVSFKWNSGRVHEDYYDGACDTTYKAGDEIDLFAPSNDLSNLAASAELILHPDETDPFAPFGPNGIRPYMLLLAALTFAFGGFLVAAGAWRRKPPTRPLPTVP